MSIRARTAPSLYAREAEEEDKVSQYAFSLCVLGLGENSFKPSHL